MGNQGYAKILIPYPGNRQADSVYGNGTLFDDAAQDGRVRADGVPQGVAVPDNTHNGPGAVNMAGHNMSAEPAACRHGPFQVKGTSRGQTGEIGTLQGFRHYIRIKTAGIKGSRGKTDAVDGNAVSFLNVLQDSVCFDGQAGTG